MEDEFFQALKEVKEDLNKQDLNEPFVSTSIDEWDKKRLEKLSKNPFRDFKLTKHQKEVIINYMLGDLGKGVFEGEEFWEDLSQDDIDDVYEVVQDQADDFYESCRVFLLKNIDHVG